MMSFYCIVQIKYIDEMQDLCSALASVGKRLCTADIPSEFLCAFVACRLVPLDKNPGVWPIAIGELPRRIISKAVLSIIGQDIADATCPLQLCAGLVKLQYMQFRNSSQTLPRKVFY